nr:MAG TPA: hypothetical protein [Caudoviricetes sp.]
MRVVAGCLCKITLIIKIKADFVLIIQIYFVPL